MNIAIVEDQESESGRLREYICQYAEKKNLVLNVRCFSNGLKLVQEFSCNFDVVFMDIEMPVMDGIETARQLREKDPEFCLIFITNIVSMAVKGYDYHAMFYLVKPVSYQVFEFKFDRVMDWYVKRSKEQIVLRPKGSLRIVSPQSIYYIETARHDIIYHTSEGDITVRNTLAAAEKELPDTFSRCNNCYLVNLKYVSEVRKDDVCVGGTWLKISETRKAPFIKALLDYMKVVNE